MRHRPRVFTSIAIVTVVALFGATVPASADTAPTPPPAPPTTPAQEALRTDVETMLTGIQAVLMSVQANPSTAAGLAATSAGQDPTAMIAAGQAQVAQLDSTQLDRLQTGLAKDPNWRQMPAQLAASVAAFKPNTTKGAASAKFPATFTDDCASAGDAPSEFIAAEIANEVQSAAQALMLASPGVIALFFFDIPTGIKIVFAVLWGVANAIYLALSQALAVSTDCAQTAFANSQISTLPVDPANPGVNVAGSSEISVQVLIVAAGNTSTEINNVLNTINAVEVQANGLTGQAATLSTTVNDIKIRVTEVQADLQLLQTNVAVLKNTEVTILGKADAEIVKLTAFQTRQLRMDIEENLTRNGPGTGAMGMFELPHANGGYLEDVRTIVSETISKETAVGNGNAKAAGDLLVANNAFTAHQWKTAYLYYTRAYQDVR